MPAPTNKRETYFIPVGSDRFVRATLSKAVYQGAIATAAGFTTTAPSGRTALDARPSNVLAGRVVASGSNSANKRRSFRIMCDTEKIEEVMAAAQGATIDGFTIDTVRSPRKHVYI